MQMYFLAIVLPEQLNKEILSYKKWMAEKFGCRVGLKSPAHITIVPPFYMDEKQEANLTLDIQNIATSTLPFSLSTDNFSAFKPRTLFVAVYPNNYLQRFKINCDAFFSSTSYPLKTDNRPFHPHITIATRDLHKKNFGEAWNHFEKKKFVAEFEAKGLSLLKHTGSKWEVVYTAPFVNPL